MFNEVKVLGIELDVGFDGGVVCLLDGCILSEECIGPNEWVLVDEANELEMLSEHSLPHGCLYSFEGSIKLYSEGSFIDLEGGRVTSRTSLRGNEYVNTLELQSLGEQVLIQEPL